MDISNISNKPFLLYSEYGAEQTKRSCRQSRQKNGVENGKMMNKFLVG